MTKLQAPFWPKFWTVLGFVRLCTTWRQVIWGQTWKINTETGNGWVRHKERKKKQNFTFVVCQCKEETFETYIFFLLVFFFFSFFVCIQFCVRDMPWANWILRYWRQHKIWSSQLKLHNLQYYWQHWVTKRLNRNF